MPSQVRIEMELMPQEVISHILQFLTISDRKEAALVCRKWYEASLDPMLLRDTVVTFHAPATTPQIFDKLGYRKTPHLILDEIDGSFSSKQFLLNQCNHLTGNLLSLSLKGSNITENLFTDLMAKCTKLESLDLSCCNSLFMTGLLLSKQQDVDRLSKSLTNLKSLNLSTIRYLSDATLNRLLSVCLNVEKLHLAGNQIIFHAEKYYAGNTTNSSVITFNNILCLLSKRAPSYKFLDFSRTAINDEALTTLASIKDLKLEVLMLVNCREIYNTGIVTLTRKQENLKSIDLSQCVDISDQSLHAICENLHHLKHLNINKCRQITDSSIKNLHMINTLQKLELSSNYVITSKALIAGVCKGKLQNLTYLNLNCCSLVKDSFIIELCKKNNNLTFLDVGSSNITDLGLQFICTYMTKLQNLNLSWCREITDKGLLGKPLDIDVEEHIHHEEEGMCKCTRKKMGINILNLPQVQQIKPKCANNNKHFLHEPMTINNIKGLQTLDLTSCHKVSDVSVIEIKLPELRHLRMAMNNGITDSSLIALAKNIKSLEELNVHQCGEITDHGVITMVRSLRRLSALYLSNCDKVTDKSLQAIHSYGQRLQVLDVSMCGKITVKQVQSLESDMRQLHTVQRRLIGGLMQE